MSTTSSNKNTIVITNVDSSLGFALAYRFLMALKNKEDNFVTSCKMRLLCRSRKGYGLEILEEMGAEIMEVDYECHESISCALKNASTVFLIPENSPKRVQEAEMVLKVGKQEKIEFVCLHSLIGVHAVENQGSKELKNIQEFHQIEKRVKESFSEKNCIIRHTKFNQMFYFMAPQIENDNRVALPIDENSKWGTIDMNDAIDAVYMLAKHEHECRNANMINKLKDMYQFTPSHIGNTKDVVKEICKGLKANQLEYVQINESDMKEYLKKMRDDKRFKERTSGPEENQKSGHDGIWTFPLGKYLNDSAIELVLECARLANMGEADIKTEDLKKILNREPRNLEQYFKTNRDNFKDFK